MKEIIYNYDFLTDEDINKYIKRAKLLIENSKNEILVVCSHKNYFLIGGHVEDGETFDECIVREIKEEAGVILPLEERTPYFSVKYLCKNHPNDGDNTKYITNYYCIKYDLIPDLNNIELTEDEIDGNFQLIYIDKNKIIDVLNEGLKTCTKPIVVRDTIDAINEYLKTTNIK